MDRVAFDAMVVQYATPEVSGNGRVSWDKGVRCVMPSVKLYGKCQQDTLTGKNLFDPNAEAVMDGSYYGYKQYFSLPKPFTLSISLKPGKALPTNSSLGYIIKKTEDSSNLANWLVLNGEIISEYDCKLVIKETDYFMEMIGVYPPSSLPSFLDALNIQIELGSTATAYEPYCGGIPAPNPGYPIMPVCNDGLFKATSPDGSWDGGQATAPELWGVPAGKYNPEGRPEVHDEWNPQTGYGLRRIKKIVFDGTENFSLNAQTLQLSGKNAYQCSGNFGFKQSSQNGICSHFEVWQSTGFFRKNTVLVLGSNVIAFMTDGVQTIDEFKTWLAEQAAAGTPVTLWTYVAEPEPFYTEPQKLTQPNGPGQIIQVSGSVPDCPIEASYLTHS